jgi:hypothetical protein
MSRIHPGVLLENEPSGKSAAIALVLGLIVVFLTTKKKFDEPLRISIREPISSAGGLTIARRFNAG